MAYTSKYKQAEIEAILDAKNNTGAGVDANLDSLFVDSLQTKEVELSADATITPDEGYLGLKEVSVKVNGGGASGNEDFLYLDFRGLESDSMATQIKSFCQETAISLGDTLVIGPPLSVRDIILPFDTLAERTIAGKFYPSQKMVMVMNGGKQEVDLSTMLPSEAFAHIPRITESEFYNLTL